MEDVLPWSGNANMAFDLWQTEDVLPWPGNANMVFDLRQTKDILPGAVRRLLGPWIMLSTKKNRLEGDPRPEPRDPPSDEENHVSAEELEQGIEQDHHVILNNEMVALHVCELCA
uniref:Uncharacterized protein n=1 Tax=Tanacetum cinerariifolium TaxID=118510 RepID=A0A6L2KAD3_TANCI|nr:hypothetical protein [Tanacetum cinerariifolium]